RFEPLAVGRCFLTRNGGAARSVPKLEPELPFLASGREQARFRPLQLQAERCRACKRLTQSMVGQCPLRTRSVALPSGRPPHTHERGGAEREPQDERAPGENQDLCAARSLL